MSWTIERIASVPSTMDEARQRARAGAPDGTVVVAEEQTGGRGTHGRAWFGPRGGLYLSLVLRGLDDARLLSLALGNAVADALEVAGVEPRLKWVNDVLVGGRKVAGILVEAESTGAHLDFAVAGVGVNVNGHAADFPPEVRAVATTVEDELQCESCIPDLETLLLDRIAHWLGVLRAGRGAEVVDAYRARFALGGKRVVVTAGGHAAIEGVADGIDGQGRLLLRTGSGTQALAHGTVRLA